MDSDENRMRQRLQIMPSGWTNGRLPKQKIIFEYEGQEIKVEYSQKRNGQFIFHNKVAQIYSSDNESIT